MIRAYGCFVLHGQKIYSMQKYADLVQNFSVTKRQRFSNYFVITTELSFIEKRKN